METINVDIRELYSAGMVDAEAVVFAALLQSGWDKDEARGIMADYTKTRTPQRPWSEDELELCRQAIAEAGGQSPRGPIMKQLLASLDRPEASVRTRVHHLLTTGK